MKELVVIIDDGHGQSTPGKRSPLFEEDTKIGRRIYREGETFIENDFNYRVADRLEEILKQNGVSCVQVAPGHVDVLLPDRIVMEHKYHDEAIRAGKQPVFISIHANAHNPEGGWLEWNNANGIETFHNPGSRAGARFARCVQDTAVARTGLRDRGVKSTAFYVLRKSKSPAVLYEGGFMTNPEEVKKLGDPSFQDITAEALYDGIMRFQESL